MQSMADLDNILGAPTVSHLRYGCIKTVQKSLVAPLHYGYGSTNIKTSKSEGHSGMLSWAFNNYLGCDITILCILAHFILPGAPFTHTINMCRA